MLKTARDLQRVALLLALFGVAGCRIVSVEQDRAIRGRTDVTFAAAPYVRGIWSQRLVPELVGKAVPLATLLPALDTPDRAGAKFGRRTAEGSAWTFTVSGTATVSAIDLSSRLGLATLAVDGVPSDRPIVMQVGPVVVGTTLRDAASFLAFDDFGDQLAFADVGRALNDQSLRVVRGNADLFRVGSRIRFVATTAPGREDAIRLTPVTLSRANSGAADAAG